MERLVRETVGAAHGAVLGVGEERRMVALSERQRIVNGIQFVYDTLIVLRSIVGDTRRAAEMVGAGDREAGLATIVAALGQARKLRRAVLALPVTDPRLERAHSLTRTAARQAVHAILLIHETISQHVPEDMGAATAIVDDARETMRAMADEVEAIIAAVRLGSS